MARPILTTFPAVSDPFQELPDSHSGLNFAYGAGRVVNDNTPADVAASTVALTNDTTNYVEVTGAGTVSANTSGFTSGRIPLYTVVTASGAIGAVTDKRAFLSIPAGSTPGVVLIEEITLGVDGTFTFDAISGGYSDLLIVGRLRDDAATHSAVASIQVGATSVDTGTNYYWNRHVGGNADVEQTGVGDTKIEVATVVGDSAPAGVYSAFECWVYGYADNSAYRQFQARAGYTDDGTDYRRGILVGEWRDASNAIDIVKVSGASGGDFKAGSKLRLYGFG